MPPPFSMTVLSTAISMPLTVNRDVRRVSFPLTAEEQMTLTPSICGPEVLFPAAFSTSSTTTTTMEMTLVRKIRVLIVDDSALNRRMLVRLLKGRLFDCLEASDGDIAVTAIENTLKPDGASGAVDLILMDFLMENLHGPQATQQIRGLGFQGLIFGVTGNVMPSDVSKFLNAGANQVLAKPLSMEALHAALTAEADTLKLLGLQVPTI